MLRSQDLSALRETKGKEKKQANILEDREEFVDGGENTDENEEKKMRLRIMTAMI